MEKKKTTIYLDEADYQCMRAIQRHYHLGSDAQAIRMALVLIGGQIVQEEEDRRNARQTPPRSEDV